MRGLIGVCDRKVRFKNAILFIAVRITLLNLLDLGSTRREIHIPKVLLIENKGDDSKNIIYEILGTISSISH